MSSKVFSAIQKDPVSPPPQIKSVMEKRKAIAGVSGEERNEDTDETVLDTVCTKAWFIYSQFCIKTVQYYVTQTGPKLVILPHLPPKCQDY